MAKASNIIVGAANVWVSYGTNSNRPDLGNSSASILPFYSDVDSNSGQITGLSSASTTSTTAWLNGNATAKNYWRSLGFTSTGVDISYEPGYSDVVVDQLLDAARLFQQSLKVIIKTELDEGTFENMNFVWGQQESYQNLGASSTASAAAINAYANSNNASASKLNIAAGALGISPIERTLVFVGNAPGTTAATWTGAGATTASTPTAGTDISAKTAKERVYVARRIIQEQTTAHALKRDAATVFPVSFRALPDDRTSSGGAEYGFVIDRVYGS
jgi:hypothetical protein